MDLRFDGTRGRLPDSDTLEYQILQACSVEDKRLWREIGKIRYIDILQAVDTLRSLGWGFHLVTLH